MPFTTYVVGKAHPAATTMPASLLALPQAVAISGFVGPEPYKRHVGGGGGQASRVYPLRALHVPAESACSAVQGIFDIDDIDEVHPQQEPPVLYSDEIHVLQRLASQHRPVEAELSRAASSAVALTSVLTNTSSLPHAVAGILAARQASSSLVTVFLRTGRNSTSLASCLSTLRHTVIVVRGLKNEDVIIDPCFRSQFVIPHAPAAYHEFLNTHVPAVLVGTKDHVRAVVTAVASAVATVYKLQDRTLPPWRKRAALLSKFVPTSFDDQPVNGGAGGVLQGVLRGVGHVDDVGESPTMLVGALVDGMAHVLRGKEGGMSPKTVFLQEAVVAL